VLGGSDKVCVGGDTLCLRLLLRLLLCATLGRRLGDIFLLASLRLLVLPEDGFDHLLTRGELGGDVHQLARLGVSHPDFRVQNPGANIITRCAGTKSHTYDESWHRIECHIFTT
jgi:hypothetical protein